MKTSILYMGDLIALLSIFIIMAVVITFGSAYGMNRYMMSNPEQFALTQEHVDITEGKKQ